jgi:hypothetical protein
MTEDDSGVMGNLPRSRPGRRSAKRGGAGDTEQQAAERTPAAAKRAASGTPAAGRAKRTSTTKDAASRRPAAAKRTAAARKEPTAAQRAAAATQAEPSPPPAPKSKSPDPFTGAVMIAGKVVESGLKVAGGIIKRLPKP